MTPWSDLFLFLLFQCIHFVPVASQRDTTEYPYAKLPLLNSLSYTGIYVGKDEVHFRDYNNKFINITTKEFLGANVHTVSLAHASSMKVRPVVISSIQICKDHDLQCYTKTKLTGFADGNKSFSYKIESLPPGNSIQSFYKFLNPINDREFSLITRNVSGISIWQNGDISFKDNIFEKITTIDIINDDLGVYLEKHDGVNNFTLFYHSISKNTTIKQKSFVLHENATIWGMTACNNDVMWRASHDTVLYYKWSNNKLFHYRKTNMTVVENTVSKLYPCILELASDVTVTTTSTTTTTTAPRVMKPMTEPKLLCMNFDGGSGDVVIRSGTTETVYKNDNPLFGNMIFVPVINENQKLSLFLAEFKGLFKFYVAYFDSDQSSKYESIGVEKGWNDVDLRNSKAIARIIDSRLVEITFYHLNRDSHKLNYQTSSLQVNITDDRYDLYHVINTTPLSAPINYFSSMNIFDDPHGIRVPLPHSLFVCPTADGHIVGFLSELGFAVKIHWIVAPTSNRNDEVRFPCRSCFDSTRSLVVLEIFCDFERPNLIVKTKTEFFMVEDYTVSEPEVYSFAQSCSYAMLYTDKSLGNWPGTENIYKLTTVRTTTVAPTTILTTTPTVATTTTEEPEPFPTLPPETIFTTVNFKAKSRSVVPVAMFGAGAAIWLINLVCVVIVTNKFCLAQWEEQNTDKTATNPKKSK